MKKKALRLAVMAIIFFVCLIVLIDLWSKKSEEKEVRNSEGVLVVSVDSKSDFFEKVKNRFFEAENVYTLNMEILFSIDAGIELWIDADKLEDEQIYEPYILIVPEEYDDKKIINVHIEDDYVREIEFHEGCQYISISNCANLESVVCSSSICELTVSNCENLKSFTFPENCYLPEISLAFLNVSSLESLDLPDTVMWIDNSFWNLNSLRELILPDGLQTISSSFVSCPSLEMVDVPDSVTLIDGGSFMGCNNLTLIVGQSSAAEEYAIENDIPYQYRDE